MKEGAHHSAASEAPRPVSAEASLPRRQWIKRSAALSAALPLVITLAPRDARAQGSGS